MLTRASARSPPGAVYFISNEPDENMIITASISSDGTLRLDRAVAAGGRGAHGVTANNGDLGVDPLFSQGAIQVSPKKRVLATVNSGSNTVLLFAIDPRKPTNIRPIGDPISSEGQFPVSLAFNGDGSRLCVLNGGAVNGVNCYNVDDKRGLVQIPNTLRYLGFNQTTPANGPPGSVSHIAFTEDNSKLVVSYKGMNGPGYLAVWDVQQDGSLSAQHSQKALASGGMVAFSLTHIPGENAFLLTDPGVGFDIVDFSAKNRQSSVAIDGQAATCWSTRSAKTGNYYTIDVGGNAIREVHVDGNLKGNVVATYMLPANTSPLDSETATIHDRDYLYVLGANATSVEVFSLDGPAKARKISSLDIQGPARAAGVAINGRNLQGMATYVRV
ncbi:hypothetical protein C8Q76DRAFT_613520 [Earliella scabrosa]|nr:hypothetical protein C8Q76DRAFT_613520 [Earliella scabrosa]